MIERIYYRVKLNTDQIIYSQNIDIVQDMGQNGDKVMSQNAVTTAINTALDNSKALMEAKLNENIIKDPSKTYLVWKGDKFPNSTEATFKAPEGCTIDWGDGTVETFETASAVVNTHTYTDGFEYHLISLSNYSSIDNDVFQNCSGLTSVTIGNGVISIGYGAFKGCSGLINVIIPDSVTSIGKYAFQNCNGLTSITIPDSVTIIGNGAFSGCSGLISVIIGNSVTSINWGTFDGCSGLTNITIPDSVTSIELYAFQNCNGLTSVTIGNGVTNIKNGAFGSCSYLKTIEISAKKTPTLGNTVFDETSIEKIIVPKSAINAYKSAAGWSQYADKIVYEVDSSDLGSVEVDNRTITKTSNEEIQAVALTNGTDLLTYAEILQATTIERL